MLGLHAGENTPPIRPVVRSSLSSTNAQGRNQIDLRLQNFPINRLWVDDVQNMGH